MKTMKFAAVIAGGILAFSACTGTADEDAPPRPPPVKEQVAPSPAPPPPPSPAPASPVERPAPVDNCGLNPADMDYKTKVQCGVVEESPAAPQESGDAGESGSESLEYLCSDPAWRANNGGYGDQQCGSDWDGSNSAPANPKYQQYQEDTGYPYSEDEYDQLPGYQQCGTACGKEPTSGELQHQYGCEQGYIPEEQC